MSDDAYARIIKVLEPEQEVPNVIGVVTSIKPLKVKIGDLEIDKDNILINPNLLDRTITASYSSRTGSSDGHSHTINLNKEKIKIESSLEVGDEVFVYRNNQVFIVVCKVVSL